MKPPLSEVTHIRESSETDTVEATKPPWSDPDNYEIETTDYTPLHEALKTLIEDNSRVDYLIAQYATGFGPTHSSLEQQIKGGMLASTKSMTQEQVVENRAALAGKAAQKRRAWENAIRRIEDGVSDSFQEAIEVTYQELGVESELPSEDSCKATDVLIAFVRERREDEEYADVELGKMYRDVGEGLDPAGDVVKFLTNPNLYSLQRKLDWELLERFRIFPDNWAGSAESQIMGQLARILLEKGLSKEQVSEILSTNWGNGNTNFSGVPVRGYLYEAFMVKEDARNDRQRRVLAK